MTKTSLLLGDCLQTLKTLPDNSIDSIVTDPPYGLSFMGKKWDYDVPSTEIWKEALRVLKPGGHMLAFFGTRTYHRGVVRIEDAGFEIRDQLAWIYGSGFPKSTDVSKRIDKEAGAEREVVGTKMRPTSIVFQHSGIHDLEELRKLAESKPLEVIYKGETAASIYKRLLRLLETPANLTGAPSTDAAKQWQGFGSALKPAQEPIVLARKPLGESTLAKNVLKHGTGALNIDASRIESPDANLNQKQNTAKASLSGLWGQDSHSQSKYSPQGRWPSNVLLDEDAASVLDEQSGLVRHSEPFKKLSEYNFDVNGTNTGQRFEPQIRYLAGASRFFYVAKSSKRERNAGLEDSAPKQKQGARPNSKDSTGKFPDHDHRESGGNNHPTVKPLKLMQYLIRMITPPGGTVLDCFMGSGSTGVAAKQLGFNFVGCELSEEYLEIAKKRIEHATLDLKEVELEDQLEMFKN